jgi:hypothetical protein
VRLAAVAALAASLALLGGCVHGEAGPRERAWDWLLEQRDAEGRWPEAFVPYLVETAMLGGKDPASWPEDRPLAAQLPWPGEGAGYMVSLRPLYAWSLLPGHGGRGAEALERVLAGHDGRQFGDPALLNDDTFALLALDGLSPSGEAARYGASLAENQSAEGGWSWAPDGEPETDMTGMALEALAGAGAGGLDAAAARAFLDATHAAGGGHAVHAGGEPNCDSTVWAVRGYRALGLAPPGDDAAFLRSLQRPDGAVAYRPGGAGNALCTAEALPALP